MTDRKQCLHLSFKTIRSHGAPDAFICEQCAQAFSEVPNLWRCATCKWADHHHGNLACDRVHDAASQAFIVGPDDTPVRLHVAPDFGCVQWEAA